MSNFEHLTNEQLRENIEETKRSLVGIPTTPNPFLAFLMFSAMDTFRKANEEPLEGEDPEEHRKLLEEYDAFVAEMKARIPSIEIPKQATDTNPEEEK